MSADVTVKLESAEFKVLKIRRGFLWFRKPSVDIQVVERFEQNINSAVVPINLAVGDSIRAKVIRHNID